jgi:uncharacterized protein YwgA
MEISELVLALLCSIPEGIKGRTVVQKLGYFASVKLKIDAGYAADFYGPYSPKIAELLQNMVELDFVVEKGRQTHHNRTMYSYSLTEDGSELAQKVKEENPEEYGVIKNIVRKCSEIVHCNYNVLSWAAKVHFVLHRARKAMTRAEAIEASQSFGWRLGKEEVESAVKLLSALGLIREE